jgi:F-type H+-transporting ATPase subunit b
MSGSTWADDAAKAPEAAATEAAPPEAKADPAHAAGDAGHGHGAADHGGDAHGEAGHGGDHGEHHETGLPMNFKADLSLWSLVTFVLFFAILSKFAWGPLSTALDQRESGIRKDIETAEANRLKSEALLKEHEAKLAVAQEEIKALLAEARRDAESTKQDIVTAAQKEAEATRKRALADIDRAKDVALGEMFDFMSKNVVQATEQVLRRSLNEGDQARLVNEALSQLDVRRN